ncbi:MAG TPA: hypothetical protein VJH03_16000 [Blastocatellia bacterium]|nr:hypothetical protein [Blastocatellia bacterium]
MTIVLLILAAVIAAALIGHAHKRIRQLQKQRLAENEYNTAVVVWTYARLVKSQIDDATNHHAGVIDFANMTVPHSTGYHVALELSGFSFRVNATPQKYKRTGRLSFYIDNSLTVRASDRDGAAATETDAEYTGEPSS